jgi:hypothetical protein
MVQLIGATRWCNVCPMLVQERPWPSTGLDQAAVAPSSIGIFAPHYYPPRFLFYFLLYFFPSFLPTKAQEI